MTRALIKPADARPAACGSKAATLARALEAGLPVPLFVVIGVDAYRQHLTRSGGQKADPAATASAILGTALAFDLGMALNTALRRLGPQVAVRSSGLAEDLPGLSFAGQYDSVLRVDSDGVEDAVLACWASVFGERAVAYRERAGVAHDRAPMAVIVQRMLECELGGVAFSADPVTEADGVVVELCAEGAEAIVSGRVAPERHEFDRATLAEGDGFDAATAAEVPEAVARLARAAEELLGVPADIEWAWADGQLWLLQARPIAAGTRAQGDHAAEGAVPAQQSAVAGDSDPVGAPASAAASDDGADAVAVRYRPTAWTNVNTGEVLPEVVTPMTWSVIGKLATGLIDALFGKLGITVDSGRLTTLVGGRAYFNASLLGSAFEQIPMRGDGDITSIFGGGEAPPGFTDLPLAPEDAARASTLRIIAGVPLIGLYFLRHSPHRAGQLACGIRAQADVAREALARATTEDEIAAIVARVVDELDAIVDAVAFSGAAMIFHGQFLGVAKRHFGEDGPALVNRLLAGQGGVASADAGLALASLGRAGREMREVGEVLRSSASWAEVRSRLEALSADGEEFCALWNAFLSEHGHHARGELEFASPRWAECPDDVLAMVVGLLDIPVADDILSMHEARGRSAADEERRVLGELGPLARVRFRWLLRNARAGARTRENVKNEGVRILAAARQAMLALGGALAGRGVLKAADDIWFLTWDEVPSVRAGSLHPGPLVSVRRGDYDRFRAITPPPVVIGEWDGSEHVPDLDTPFAPDTLSGLGVAAGVARGPARVIRSLTSDERVLPGEVLVAPFTDPGWTPYFIPAAAIVVDMGGMLSHGSIIAREYGIPGVVNVGPATSIIATGDTVEVDGSRGVVTIVERVADRAE